MISGARSAREPSTTFALAAVLLSCGILTLLGLVVIFSVTALPGAGDGAPAMFRRQVAWVAVSAVAALALARCDYRKVVRAAPVVLLVTWALLVLALASPARLGAARWISAGSVSFQPSELARLALLLWICRHLDRNEGHHASFRRVAGPALGVVLVTVGLVVAAPDYGTSLFLFALSGTLLAVGGVGLRHLVPVAAVALPLMLLAVLVKFDHVARRLSEYVAPVRGSHVDLAISTLAIGGLAGRGLGEGRSHLGFLPMVHNDFIMAAVGEQFGFIGAVAVILLYVTIFRQGLRLAGRAPDRAGFLLVFGVVFMIALQAAVNLAVVTGTAPAKGISLPFLSAGGSSLLVIGLGLGLVASVARRSSSGAFAEEAGLMEAASATGPPARAVRHDTTLGDPGGRVPPQPAQPAQPALESRQTIRFRPTRRHPPGRPDLRGSPSLTAITKGQLP